MLKIPKRKNIKTRELRVQYIDSATKRQLPFVSIALLQNDKLIAQATSGMNGEYRLSHVPPGRYEVEIKFLGYVPQRFSDVEISFNNYTQLNIKLAETNTHLIDTTSTTYTNKKGKTKTHEYINGKKVKKKSS